MKRWKIILITLLVIIVGCAATVWFMIRNNFHEVVSGEVYRSAQLSAGRLESVVAEYGFKTVVSLRRPRPDKRWFQNEVETLENLGVTRHDIAMDLTFSPRIDHLLDLRDYIQNAPRPLLMYCRGGADRTGLAGVMTLLLDGSSSLEEARAQVDLDYLAVRDDSVGILIFDAYLAWLEVSDFPHTSERFNQWLENEFVDLSGNIHFLVDAIEGQVWERPWGLINEGHEFQVRRSDTEILELSGWAFDTRNTSLLDSVEIYLDGTLFEDRWYGIYQPWLMKDFNKEEYLDSGWMASHPLDQFEDGCHELVLKFIRTDGSSWTSPPSARICIS